MEGVASFGALGFWFFLAVIVVGGMWFDARKRETQQETLRRIVEMKNEWIAVIVAPVNSVAGLVGLLFLALHTLYRRTVR